MLPFSTTAFDLKSMRSDILSEGPLELVCFASGAFPPLFPPVHIKSALYTDVPFTGRASGCRGLRTLSRVARLAGPPRGRPLQRPLGRRVARSPRRARGLLRHPNGQHARRGRCRPARSDAAAAALGRRARSRRRRLGPSLGARRAGPPRLPRRPLRRVAGAGTRWRCRRSSPAWRGWSWGRRRRRCTVCGLYAEALYAYLGVSRARAPLASLWVFLNRRCGRMRATEHAQRGRSASSSVVAASRRSPSVAPGPSRAPSCNSGSC